MKIKKRNIELAISVCIIMIMIFIYVHFAEERDLFLIGCSFEKLLHIHTDISVLKMQSFIEAIVSGIFGSSMVAMFFYIQDYQCEREKTLNNAMEFVNKYCEIYSHIPYCRFFENSEYAKLAQSYYIEYYNNQLIMELKKKTDNYLKTIPKAARRVLKAEVEKKNIVESTDSKMKIEKYLNEYIKDIDADCKKDRIEDELNTIIKEIDYKAEQSINAYKEIMELDLSKFSDLIEAVITFKSYGLFKKRFIRKYMQDQKIFPQLYVSIKDLLKEQWRHIKAQDKIYGKMMAACRVREEYRCNTENILRRIHRILLRTQRYIDTQFSVNNYSKLKKFNKNELLVLLKILQKDFIAKDDFQIMPDSEPITFSYNKLVYSIINLKMILLYELTERYKYREKRSFAMTKDAYEENVHVWSKSYSGEDLRNDFYRI